VISRPGGKVRRADIEGPDGAPALSPDGRWLAQASEDRIVVRAIPADPDTPLPAGTREVAAALNETARQTQWSADGKELFVLLPQAMMSIAFNWSDGTPRPGPLRKLFDLSDSTAFDVTPDGRRFLVTEPAGERDDPPIVLVQNWWKLLGR
jgi:hypothetical protein